jgi:hypothetical protein
MDLSTSMVRAAALPPTPSIRIYAYTSLGLYESQLPEMKDYQSMFNYFSGQTVAFDNKKKYYGPATANKVMAAMLRKFLTADQYKKSIDSLEQAYTRFFENVADKERIASSVEYGQRLADAIFEWGSKDGALTPCPAWVEPVGPGLWQRTPPGFAAAAGACQGNVRCFIKDATKIFDPGTPLAYSTDTSSAFYKAAMENYAYSKRLTRKDSMLAQSWRDIPPVNMNGVTRLNKLLTGFLSSQTIFLDQASLSFLKQNIAMFDAINATFAAKFKYNLLRPITYIRNDMGQSNYNTVIPTLLHPAYPSVNGSTSAASALIWESLLGPQFGFTDQTLSALYGSFEYKNIQDFVQQTGEQRVSSGINFRFSVDAGQRLGKKIAEEVNKLPFKVK